MGHGTISPWSNVVGSGDRRVVDGGNYGPIWSKLRSVASKNAKKLDTRNATGNEDSFHLPYPMTLRFQASLIFFRASDRSVWPNSLING